MLERITNRNPSSLATAFKGFRHIDKLAYNENLFLVANLISSDIADTCSDTEKNYKITNYVSSCVSSFLRMTGFGL